MKNSTSSPSRITINGRFLSQEITGVQRYAHEMLTALDVLLSTGAIEPLPVTVLTPPNATKLPHWSFLRVQAVGHLTGHLWEQMDLPVHAHGTLLFTPCGGAPVLHRDHVITIHDAGPFKTPDAYTSLYRNYYKILQRIMGQAALHIITVSKFARQELIQCLGIPEQKISHTWLSGEHILRQERDSSVLSRHSLSPRTYVFAVGSRNPNKNLRRLVDAAAHLQIPDIRMAIAGGSNAAIFGSGSVVVGPVQELGFVRDSELRTLYENAACFVYPSSYEGFGLPPLEALTLGCPVVASRAASLPEVLGDAVTYCDPCSPEHIAGQISRVLHGQHPSRDAALQHAAKFTWERCARETWGILLNTLRS